LQGGVLSQRGKAWRWHARPDRLQAPETIQRLVERQLQRLDRNEQQLLEIASVAGMEFSADLLAKVLSDSLNEVEGAFHSLARRQQFIRVLGTRPLLEKRCSARFAFRHGVSRWVLYERTCPARRLHLHLEFGQRLEFTYGARARLKATELAAHFEQGRDPRRAAYYLRLAGTIRQTR